MANVGRPTKFNLEMIQKVDEYIDWVKSQKKQLASVEGFAAFIGVTDWTIWAWANKKLKDESGKPTNKLARPEFSNAIKRIMTLQKHQLMTEGFYGGREVNAAMAIFLLKVNHGMKETEHVDHTSGGNPMPIPIQVVSYRNALKDS